MDIYIYGLYNSFSDDIRYVGKTNDVKRRLSEHITEAKSGKYKHLPKNKWILKTINNGGKIFLKVIEKVSIENWEEREVYWISHYKNLPGNLNLSRGGETSKEHFFLSYEDCKKWVRENIDISKINSSSAWKGVAKEGKFPFFIPHNPWSCYRSCGFSWYDFLGKKENRYYKLKANYLTFDELSKYVKKNGINSIIELQEKVKKENIVNIPRDIKRYYLRRGFNVSDLFCKFFSYDEFVIYIKENYPFLTSVNEYQKAHKTMCSKAPYYFREIYGKKVNENDIFFEKFLTYEECKKSISELKLKTSKEYRLMAKKSENKYPAHPDIVYKGKGWKTWTEFLNGDVRESRKNCDFDVFCRYMKIFHPNVKKSTHYIKMMKNEKISKRLPFRPDIKYKCCWKDIFDKIKNL